MTEVVVNVSSDGNLGLIRQYHKYIYKYGNDTRIAFNVAATISAESYEKIMINIDNANKHSGRHDYIVNPRNPPYEPPSTITVRNYFELKAAILEKAGEGFIIIIPRDVSRIVATAPLNKVQFGGYFRDMWND